MKTKHIYIIIGILAFAFRLFLNYQSKFNCGIGGAYYLIQIREILNSGHMAIDDMPLLFYLLAFFVKIFSFILPNVDIGAITMNTVKIFDSSSIPFMLIPFYFINKSILSNKIEKSNEVSLAAFILLSFAPLDLSTDAVKNIFALGLFVLFIYLFLKFIKEKQRKFLFWSLATLIVIMLTHFGTFTITLIFFVLGLVVFYKRKAIIPMLIILVVSIAIVAIFDFSRAWRLIMFWKNAPEMLSPRLAYYPYGVVNYLFSFTLIGVIITVLRKQKDALSEFEKRTLILFLFFITILALPIYNFETARRFGLMIFVPQSVVLLFLFQYFSKTPKKIMLSVILIFVAASITYFTIKPKQPLITDKAHADLKQISNVIDNPENTIIFAFHGLNWWVNWELNTKSADANLKLSENIKSKYKEIYFLSNLKGKNHLYPGYPSPFRNPEIPESCTLVYHSDYFELYKYNEE